MGLMRSMLQRLGILVSDTPMATPAPPAAAALQWPGPRRGATVLFLDFDGVMHPAESGSLALMPNLIRLLLAAPEVDVVLSTNWRLNASRDYLLDLFPVEIRHRIAGVTPEAEEGAFERERECEEYLARHSIDRAVAVDDDASLFSPSWHRLFLVDRYQGLTAEQAERLIGFLHEASPSQLPDQQVTRGRSAHLVV